MQSFLSKIPDDHRAKNVATIKDLIVANALRYDTKGSLRFHNKLVKNGVVEMFDL